jgi:hypothetical protein
LASIIHGSQCVDMFEYDIRAINTGWLTDNPGGLPKSFIKIRGCHQGPFGPQPIWETPKTFHRAPDSHLELCGLQPNRQAPNGPHTAFWIPFGVPEGTNQAGRLQTASTELHGVYVTSVSRNQAGSLQMVHTQLSATNLKTYGSQPSRGAPNV